MSVRTEELAREMVHYETLIRDAARDHRWTDAQELEVVRERLVDMRYLAYRREWQARREASGGVASEDTKKVVTSTT